MKIRSLFLPALALATGLVAAEPIKVGEFACLTGKDATFGQSQHKGIMLALEEINAAGGVLGQPVEVLTEDNQSKPGDSATVAKKLLSRDKVVAILGELGHDSALKIVDEADAENVGAGLRDLGVGRARGDHRDLGVLRERSDFQGATGGDLAEDRDDLFAGKELLGHGG